MVSDALYDCRHLLLHQSGSPLRLARTTLRHSLRSLKNITFWSLAFRGLSFPNWTIDYWQVKLSDHAPFDLQNSSILKMMLIHIVVHYYLWKGLNIFIYLLRDKLSIKTATELAIFENQGLCQTDLDLLLSYCSIGICIESSEYDRYVFSNRILAVYSK